MPKQNFIVCRKVVIYLSFLLSLMINAALACSVYCSIQWTLVNQFSYFLMCYVLLTIVCGKSECLDIVSKYSGPNKFLADNRSKNTKELQALD